MSDDGGLAKFQRHMRAVPEAARRAVVPALVKSADEVADVMRATVPVDDGDLRDSIKVTGPGLSTPPYSQPGGSMVVPELTAAITAGNADVRYAHLVEYGHGNGFGGTTVPPHPFFWPSFRLTRKRALNRIKRAVGKAIREAK
ncbi:HK97 gp10 family phage protein [Paracoccus sp. TOH]|uniref:HK97 gp10 family phage protein n=1 Tax=Paracoccus sp. TOH TaxID=1263728 RepID=UPI0025AFFFBB|nr:HK97 gp10 family phage protein [Paracoccus sp. TOH]WJS83544.1 HK97 gp10 family phage protein [Paracoccus sp. TOH]